MGRQAGACDMEMEKSLDSRNSLDSPPASKSTERSSASDSSTEAEPLLDSGTSSSTNGAGAGVDGA